MDAEIIQPVPLELILEELTPAAPELPSPTDEQMRQFKEDQEAFEAMLHYSPEMAYGITGDPLRDAARRE